MKFYFYAIGVILILHLQLVIDNVQLNRSKDKTRAEQHACLAPPLHLV